MVQPMKKSPRGGRWWRQYPLTIMIMTISISVAYSSFMLGKSLRGIITSQTNRKSLRGIITSQTQSNNKNNRYPDKYTSEDSQIVIIKTLDMEHTPWPKPQAWDGFSYQRMWKHFKCRPYSNDRTKPLPTMEHWQLLRDAYTKYVDPTIQFNDPTPPTLGYTLKNGQPPPFIAKHSDKGGRGLFASRRIKEGEIIHDGEIDSLEFSSPASFREFIFSLPRNRACDMLDWVWTQRQSENDPLRLYVAFTITVLWNGMFNKKLRNAALNVNPESSFSSKFIALRDIDEGEELLFDYGIYETDYEAVGL